MTAPSEPPWRQSADAIVTGNQDLLTLGRIGQIQVLTLREFLESLLLGT